MKAGIFYTGTGPILILTSYESFTDARLVEKLQDKGIKKFIAYEVDENTVRDKYGRQFDMVMNDLRQSDDLRVLDYDGHHVFYNFAFNELSQPIHYEH
jgi:hypothetical protein